MPMLLRALCAALFVFLAACGGGSDSGPRIAEGAYPPIEEQAPLEQERRRYDKGEFVEPRHMQGEKPVRVALLLPFTASSPAAQKIASAMFDSAQLAAFDAGDTRFLLIPKDTKGTPDGAREAVASSLADGAEIILGPLFSESTAAAAPEAQAAGVPMIAFSSDNAVAGDGVYLLSYPPELEIARVTDFALAQEITRFGLLAPQSEYGARVSGAFAQEVATKGGVIVAEERYEQEPDAMLAPAKRLAQYSKTIIPSYQRHGFDGERPSETSPDASLGFTEGYQAVLMPEQGTLLRALAPLLPYYNVDINQVKLLGVSSWNNPRLTREPALRGGWFAAPDPTITRTFENRYAGAFGAAPPRLASLSYDATLLAARLARNPKRKERFSIPAITDPNGYFGADGLFRLRTDGRVDRGLAILEIQPAGIRVIDPAPRSFAPGF